MGGHDNLTGGMILVILIAMIVLIWPVPASPKGAAVGRKKCQAAPMDWVRCIFVRWGRKGIGRLHYWGAGKSQCGLRGRRGRRHLETADAGTNWAPVFDHENVSAVGALAMAPSARDVIWAGTGEPWLIRPYYTMGDGVYKSTDAGRSWQHMGLQQTGTSHESSWPRNTY